LLAEAISKSQIVSLDVSRSKLTWTDNGSEYSMEGIIALANVIKDMGAMTSLNLAANDLGVEGAKIIAEATKVAKCVVMVVL
jgi:hypothetical protein